MNCFKEINTQNEFLYIFFNFYFLFLFNQQNSFHKLKLFTKNWINDIKKVKKIISVFFLNSN